MFAFDALSHSVKKEILEMLNRYISSGMNLYNSIDSASKDVKDKKIAMILKKVQLDADRLNDIPLALKNNGVLNAREYTILVNAKKNIKVALTEIIKLSDSGSLFEKMMFKVMVLPLLIFSALMFAPSFIAPYIKSIFNDFKRTLSIELELDWYLSTVIDYAHVYAMVGAVVLIALGTVIFVYFYTYKNRIDLTYKLFKYKSVVDTPYILNLMVSLNKSTGMNLTYVCTALKNTVAPRSLGYFFEKIEREKNNNNLFNTFIGFGFDRGVSRLCSLGQNKGINDFWLNMEKGMIFSEEQLAAANDKWNKRGKTNMMLVFFVGIAILINSIGYVTMMSSKIEQTLKKEMGGVRR
ncbi:MAG: hypothetical protein QG567_843 [Campylobacterota bacterium]|nr:hypothetical protein [Campylobacterota bacterium]